jgi:hypothetical protein
MPVYHSHVLELTATVLGTVLILMIPIVIVVIVLRHRRAMAVDKQRTILELAGKGVPIPTELLQDSPQKPGVGDLRRGLILSGAGIGAIIFAFTLPEHAEWGIGLLPLFVGLGYLATWLCTRSERSSDSDA